jgi:hypothetical protein
VSNQQPYEEPKEEPRKSGKPTHEIMRRQFAEGKVKMRKKLLAIGYQMGYGVAKTETEKRMKGWEVCKLHVNRWLLSEKSTVRKEMDDMTYKELVQAVTQFEQVYKEFLKRV